MSNDIRKQYFDDLWNKHPNGDAGTVGWGSKESQQLRFKKLAVMVPEDSFCGKTVLDVGCGLGDFFEYIHVPIIYDEDTGAPDIALTPSLYVGIDMTKKTIETAQKKYEGYPQASFITGNFLEHNFEGTVFDYVVASGIFSIKTFDWMENTTAILKKMFRFCRIGVATNFLSSVHKNRIVTSKYVHPATILALCIREVTPWVSVLHDYRTNDFTIHMFREQQKES